MKPEVSAKILANIKKKTKKFSPQKQNIIAKLDADHDLVLTRTRTHLVLILNMLKNEGVIDQFSVSNPIDLFGVDGNVLCFSLRKTNSSNIVHIFTDGEHLVLRDGGFLIDFGDITADCVRCDNIEDIDKYDWVGFSDLLLAFVYRVIYNVARVTEIAMFGANK